MRPVWLISLLLLLWSDISNAETYKYIDDKGTPCFTDDIKTIPERHRKKAVLLKSDDEKVTVLTPPLADKIDETLLPQKEEARYTSDTSSVHIPIIEPQSQGFPYLNVAIISSMFLGTLISAVFVNNRMFKKILNIVSLASMLTLLVYVSTFFVSKNMHTLKKASTEMTDTMKRKEAQKKKALQEVIGGEPPAEGNR
ncbi:MAG: hypothetical protein Q7T53_09980 [Deltaproteobacteria bacterium]|nr:hypothetical protein [Deltaproteobacteria bacterium]